MLKQGKLKKNAGLNTTQVGLKMDKPSDWVKYLPNLLDSFIKLDLVSIACLKWTQNMLKITY